MPHDLGYESLIEAGEPTMPEEPEEEDPVVLMYTGGTTGLPKGVLLEQRAEMLNLYHIGLAVGFADNRVYLHQTPMFHAASMGAVLGIPATGGISTFVPMFEPGQVLDNDRALRRGLDDDGADHDRHGPRPSGLHALSASPRCTTSCTAPRPCRPPCSTASRTTFPDMSIWQGYGMTESSSVLTFLTADDHRRGGQILRSAGRPAMGVNICIQDEDGKVLGPRQEGEVCARAGNFLREYWHRPEQTEHTMRGGWYHTGDVGYIDEEGYVYLVDRLNDMIVTGGENVYSIEVENAISTHPAVAQVAVIGIPHDVWGEQVHAVVVVRPGAEVTEEEIKEHARRSVANYKVPKSVELRSEPLPTLRGAQAAEGRSARAFLGRPRDPRALGGTTKPGRRPPVGRSSPSSRKAPSHRSLNRSSSSGGASMPRSEPASARWARA